MSAALSVWVSGIGLWAPGASTWDAFRDVVSGGAPSGASERPVADVLPPNERRRAPESVLLAAAAAGQAVRMSGRDAATLPCVFASAHGDQVITDYMCQTLATAPLELSPTKFHNSVHNAPAGYWTIATHFFGEPQFEQRIMTRKHLRFATTWPSSTLRSIPLSTW